jgi:hypothetical protein
MRGDDVVASDNGSRPRLGFAGHETFPFRYGWLTKAVGAIRRNPRAFSDERAVVELGVGKNMVESIRHWGLATQILVEGDGRTLRVSDLGAKLIEEWDPYLEDPGSIWLAHWLIANNPVRAGAWHLVFSQYPQTDFTKQSLIRWMLTTAERRGVYVRESTIKRDVDCLVRCYVPSIQNSRSIPEDAFDCPLSELLLVQDLRDAEAYRFAIGPKRSLPALVVGFSLLDFARRAASNRSTLSLGECMYGDGSPGQAFRLDENSLVEYVEDLSRTTRGRIQFDETSGLKQVYLDQALNPNSLLAAHYGSGEAE